MKKKDIQELLEKAYIDTETGTLNNFAYVRDLKKLCKNRKDLKCINAAVISLKRPYNNGTIKSVLDYIQQVFREIAVCYRINESEFAVISDRDIRGYISELRDLIAFDKVKGLNDIAEAIRYVG